MTELVHVLSPLVQQAQDLTEAVSEHLHLAITLTDIIKSHKAIASQGPQHQSSPAEGDTHLAKSTDS